MSEAIALVISKIESLKNDAACTSAIYKLAKKEKRLKELPEKIDRIGKQLSITNEFIEKQIGTEHLANAIDETWIATVRRLALIVEDVMEKYLYHGLRLQEEGSQKHPIKGPNYAVVFGKIADVVDQINGRIGRLLSIREQIQPASQLVTNQLRDARFVDAEAQPDLIGIDVPMDELLKFLLPGEAASMLQLRVLSIIGFGGIGKTALAFEVYRRLQEKFECHAFVKVSRWPDTKRILGDILGKLTRQNHRADMDKIQLINQIEQYLKGRRYLIVIDDLWDKQLWETIKGALPDGSYGSRVMATTRLNDIAQICCSRQHDFIYKVKPLAYLDSRKLLLKGDLDHEGSCSDAPTEVSDEILKVCGGMPLALKCIGSVLPNNKLVTVESQKIVLDSLLSASDNFLDLTKLTKTLFLSCSGPPYTLETCALYLSTFPENNYIKRDSLIRKWIADGIICKEHQLSLEKVANKYFDELINRNVIQQVDNIFGETYEIHSMMLYTLRKISQERNFATFLSEFGISMPCEQPIRRLSFQCSDIGISILRGDVHILHKSDLGHPIKKSTLFLARSVTICGHANPVSFKLLEHLHVLDLEGCKDLENCDMDDICRMILLQYLSLKKTRITEISSRIENLRYLKTLAITQTQITKLPPQIGKLQNLETLDIRQTLVEELPRELVELQKLKTLDLRQNQISDLPQQITKLQNLETLDIRQTRIKELPKELVRLPKLAHLLFGQSGFHGGVKLTVGANPSKSLKALGAIDSRQCSRRVLEELSRMTELTELAVVCYDGPDDDDKKNHDLLNIIGNFNNLQSLTIYGDFILGNDLPVPPNPPKLWKLKVAGRCLYVPDWIGQLSNITFLDIRVCRLEENDLRIFGAMSSLRKLLLTQVLLPIKQLVITGGESFASLETFTFDSRLPWVAFKDGAMPRLENLELKLYAGPAGKIPSGILCLPRLMKVIVQYSSHYASSVSVADTIAVMREEGGKHANQIVLCVNGKQEIVPHNIVDSIPSQENIVESKIGGGEIEE